MIASMRYFDATGNSDWSVTWSFMCASEPTAPLAPDPILISLNKIVIEWDPPTSDGGSSILGYWVYMKEASETTYNLIYDGKENAATWILEITEYLLNPLQVNTYQIYVVAFNWVGISPQGAVLPVVIQEISNAALSEVYGPGIGTINAAVPV